MFRRNRSLHHQMSQSRVSLNQMRRHPDMPAKTVPNLVIVQTYAVDGPPGTGIYCYEIYFAPDLEAGATRMLTVTKNKDLYEQAVKAEGYPTRFDVTYHPSQQPNGIVVRMLESFDPVSR